MSDPEKSELTDRPERDALTKNYEPPTIVGLGRVAELTRGASYFYFGDIASSYIF